MPFAYLVVNLDTDRVGVSKFFKLFVKSFSSAARHRQLACATKFSLNFYSPGLLEKPLLGEPLLDL